MSYGIGDFVADVATGGAYSLTRKTTEAATNTASEIFAETGTVVGGVSSGGAPGLTGPANTGACCPRYQLVGDFLLETMTGRVWKYDSQDDVFVHVPKRVSPMLGTYLKHWHEAAKATVGREAQAIADVAYPTDRQKAKEIQKELLAAMARELDTIQTR